MKLLSTVVAVLAAISCYAQNFQPGYFINKQGKRTDGFFDMERSTTQEPWFSATADGAAEPLHPDNTAAYGIGNEVKLVSSNINFVDRKSGSDTAEKQLVFLQVVLEGPASLFFYSNGSYTTFYIQKTNGALQELIYRRATDAAVAVKDKNEFRQQLYSEFKAAGMPTEDFTMVKYERDALMALFQKYNNLVGQSSVVYNKFQAKESHFSFTAFAGVASSSGNVETALVSPPSSAGVSPTVGVEVLLKFPRSPWGIAFRADYHKVSYDEKAFYTEGVGSHAINWDLNFVADINVLDFYLGPRYYVLQTKKHSVFLDAAIVVSVPSGDFRLNSVSTDFSGVHQQDPIHYRLSSTLVANFGLGYTFNKRYGAALHFTTPKTLNDDPSVKISFNTVAATLRYTIF